MGYQLGLIAAIAVFAWMALDLFAPGRRRSSVSLGVLGVTAGLWALGDLLDLNAHAPQQVVLARSLRYVGACFIGACWLWVSLQAARPPRWARRPWLIALAFVPSAFFYSCVYWDHQGWFVDWATRDRGPLFIAHTAWSWSLIAIGIAGFGQAARRLRKASRARMIMLLVGTLTPLAGNAIYLVHGAAIDPTPLLLGFGGLLIRYAIVDAGITFSLPLGRSDVVEQLEVGVVVADLEDIVVDANRASHALLEREKLVGRPLGELLDAVEANPNRTLERRCFPLRNGRMIVGTGVVIEDRTEARRTEQRLQLAARLETVGSLTAGIAHEVNNPLAYVSSNLSQLEKLTAALTRPEVFERLPQDVRWLAEDGPEMARDASDGMRRIAELVQRLRRFARDEPGHPAPQPLDLAQVSRTAVAMARVGAPPNAIRTRFEAAPPADAVESDLVQIALNLLVNAIQAADGDPHIELEVLPWNGGAALRVLDRGPGIPNDLLPRIFDPFFTTKLPGQGTGLGLSLSYDLARRHGGRLEAENRPGGGAAFTLWLPAARPDAT
jgi:signal transduction histidine kinase